MSIWKRNGKPVPTVDFWARVDVQGEDDCWLWLPSVDGHGYGRCQFNGRPRAAHQVAYEIAVGPIPAGHELDHTCHNADTACLDFDNCPHHRCVNPAHLEPVTHQENCRRGNGRLISGSRTHCPSGHAYAEHGVSYPSSKGKRECRECKRLRSLHAARRRRDARAAA